MQVIVLQVSPSRLKLAKCNSVGVILIHFNVRNSCSFSGRTAVYLRMFVSASQRQDTECGSRTVWGYFWICFRLVFLGVPHGSTLGPMLFLLYCLLDKLLIKWFNLVPFFLASCSLFVFLEFKSNNFTIVFNLQLNWTSFSNPHKDVTFQQELIDVGQLAWNAEDTGRFYVPSF